MTRNIACVIMALGLTVSLACNRNEDNQVHDAARARAQQPAVPLPDAIVTTTNQ